MSIAPPRTNIDLPIIVHIKQLYKIVYQIGNGMPKRDKLGIHKNIEDKCIVILSIAIDSALSPKKSKLESLAKLRREVETLKHLIRMEHELNIIKEKTYIYISQILQNISMMATGWYKSLQIQTENPRD